MGALKSTSTFRPCIAREMRLAMRADINAGSASGCCTSIDLLAADWGVAANVWSCPSFNELTRDGQDAERFNLLHPTDAPKVPFVAQQLEPYVGPVVASTDYMKAYAEQIDLQIELGGLTQQRGVGVVLFVWSDVLRLVLHQLLETHHVVLRRRLGR